MSLETLKPKIERLIEKAQNGGGLPDWDDDSPIIATIDSRYESNNSYCELTEKGTLKILLKDKSKAGSFIIRDTVSSRELPLDWRRIAPKIKQVYVEEGITAFEVQKAVNCERIKMPTTLTKLQCNSSYLTSIKEMDLSSDYFVLGTGVACTNYVCLEKVILSPKITTLRDNAFQYCFSLKDIDLSNITGFGVRCFQECLNLEGNIVFNENLTYIYANAFDSTAINSITFKNNVDKLPSITSTAFSYCNFLTDIYCPWAEGAVENAPWGATNATIHYNTTFDENGNPIATEV